MSDVAVASDTTLAAVDDEDLAIGCEESICEDRY